MDEPQYDGPERRAQAAGDSGGGVVAGEMAQALHGLGAGATTMLVRGSKLLRRMEPFAGGLVARSLVESGIDLRMGVSATRVERPDPKGP